MTYRKIRLNSIKDIISKLFNSKNHPTAQDIAQRWREKGVRIGENTLIYPDVNLGRDGKDPIIIGNDCVLTGCTILGHDASTNKALGLERSMIQPVIIEDDCFIGFQSIILMGVTVGKGAIVGAGAVVTRDVPPGSIVAGNPAKVIGFVNDLVERRKLIAELHPEFFPQDQGAAG